MLVNADFTRPAIVAPEGYRWIASPSPGVERVMLDRVGGEAARATSIVRYAPGAGFPAHSHPGGEEILVLSGTFSADGQHFPAGWYLRNPPGSVHQPASAEGATIFVKLMQMEAAETQIVRIDTRDPAHWQMEEGRGVCRLFSNGMENVSLQRLAPGAAVFQEAGGTVELLVLEGGLAAPGGAYARGTWMRFPAGERGAIAAGAHGAAIYLKTGFPAGTKGSS